MLSQLFPGETVEESFTTQYYIMEHAPDPEQAKPEPKAQRNFTDPDSRIMKDGASKSFEQCYNAQAAVDTESLLVIVPAVTQAGTDKEQVEPMLGQIQALPVGLNQPERLLADNGFYSEKNVDTCRAAKIEFQQ